MPISAKPRSIIETPKGVDKFGAGNRKPTVIKWNGESMMRTHSVRGVARQILRKSLMLDLVKVNILGPQSTGKTELMYTLAHLMHTDEDMPYSVKFFSREELLHLKDTVAKLPRQNYILGFDDISFLGSTSDAHQITRLQQEFSEIRHLPGGDVRVIAMFLFHYGKALPPFLRQSDFWVYTAIGSEESKYASEIMQLQGARSAGLRINEFKRVVGAAQSRGTYSYRISKDLQFSYKYRKPFAPFLVFDGERARHAVFPQRTWIRRNCATCNNAADKPQETLDIPMFKDAFEARFGKSITKQALRHVLWTQGFHAYRDEVSRAIIWLQTRP